MYAYKPIEKKEPIQLLWNNLFDDHWFDDGSGKTTILSNLLKGTETKWFLSLLIKVYLKITSLLPCSRFTNSCYSDHKKEKIIIRIKNINFLWHLIVKADHHWETKRGQCHHFIMIYFSLAEMKMIWFLELVMEFSFSCYPYASKRNLKITKRSQCHHLIIMYFSVP